MDSPCSRRMLQDSSVSFSDINLRHRGLIFPNGSDLPRALRAPPQPPGRCKIVPGGSHRALQTAARPRGCPQCSPARPGLPAGCGATSPPARPGPGPFSTAAEGLRSGRLRDDQPFYAARCCRLHLVLHRAAGRPRLARSRSAALAARPASPEALRPGPCPGSACGSAGPGRTRAAWLGAPALRRRPRGRRGGAGRRHRGSARRGAPGRGGAWRGGERFCFLSLGGRPRQVPCDPAERRGRPGGARRGFRPAAAAARVCWHCPCRWRERGSEAGLPRVTRGDRLCRAALRAARGRFR